MKTVLRWIPATILLLAFTLLWISAISGGLPGVISWYTLQGGLPILGGLSLLSIVAIFVWKRQITAPLLVTLLVSLLVIWPFLWQLGILRVAYPSSLETSTPAATLRLPANEALLVAWGGDKPRVNQHTISPEERWAYDLLIEPALLQSSHLEDYGCWGVPVVAPASGEVVVA